MRKISLLLTTAVLALQNSGARAADFGPQNWAETHVTLLYMLTGVLLALTLTLKPAGVPFSEIFHARWTGLPKLVFWATRLCIFALIAALFNSVAFSFA
jgi:hypothetical protein